MTAFYDAARNGDAERLARLSCRGELGGEQSELLDALKELVGSIDDLQVGAAEVSGEVATVPLSGVFEGRKEEWTAEAELIDGSWKVCKSGIRASALT